MKNRGQFIHPPTRPYRKYGIIRVVFITLLELYLIIMLVDLCEQRENLYIYTEKLLYIILYLFFFWLFYWGAN